MGNFITAYRITRENEGGWHGGTGVNAADRGGETFKGIARRHHEGWRGWILVDGFRNQPGFPNNALNDPELNRLTLEFYKLNFWDSLRLSEIEHQPTANEMFDTAVNMGTAVAARFLQRALNYLNRNGQTWRNIAVDGSIGPVTLGTFNRLSSNDKRHVFNILNILQGSRYISIVDNNPTQEVFLRGWLERVELMRRD